MEEIVIIIITITTTIIIIIKIKQTIDCNIPKSEIYKNCGISLGDILSHVEQKKNAHL